MVGCDMPFINPNLVRFIAGIAPEADVILPATPEALQPLHALYRRSCLTLIEQQLLEGNLSVLDLYPLLRTRTIPAEEMRSLDPEFRSFLNLNTREDYERLATGTCQM